MDFTPYIRTYVPVYVAAFVTWLSDTIGVHEVDSAAASAVAVSIVLTVYYGAVKLIEGRWPAAGKLLGRAKAPTYQ